MEEKDPITPLVVALLFFLLYVFGTILANQKDQLDLKNDLIHKEMYFDK